MRRALPPWAWLVAAFFASRALAWAAGVRFDMRPLREAWHVLDLGQLTTRLGESLFYLHSQPPLFNLAVGLGLKTGAAGPWVFQCAYMALGLALGLAVLGLMRRLGVRPWLAIAIAIAFSVSPSAILYENWLLYTLPVAAMLAGAAWAGHRLVERPTVAGSLLFFSLLAAACLTRPIYHLIWLLAVAALVLTATRYRRAVLIGAVVPVLLVVGVYAKNAWVFGSFSASTWLGMNVARISLGELAPARRADLVAEGRVSDLALYSQFQPLSSYPERYRKVPATGIPVLDAPGKNGGEPNFNNAGYIALSRDFMEVSRGVMRYAPDAYLKGVAKATMTYFRSSSDYGLIETNRQRIDLWDRLYDKAVYGCLTMTAPYWSQPRPPADASAGVRLRFELANTAWFLVVGLPVLWLAGAWLALRRFRQGRPADGVALAFMTATALFATAIGNGLDVGENNRFRFDIDPLHAVLLGIVIESAIAKATVLRGRRRRI